MKKRFSIYHFLIIVLIFSMFTPLSNVFAQVNGGGNGDGDKQPTGSLTIHKLEQEKGTERGDGDGSKVDDLEGEPLAGVEYTITQTHVYDPDTDTWTTGSGESKEFVTDDDGKIVIDPIPLGRYTVKETDWPDNVVGNDEEFTVDIPMTSKDGSSVNYNVHIYPKNETIRGGATLVKKDGDSPEKTLDGVQFKIFYKNGEPVTDDKGEPKVLTTENGKVTIEGLEYGKYYFKEIATIGNYLLNKKKVEFSVNEQGASKEVSLENYVKPEVEKEVDETHVNRGKEVEFTITVQLPGDIANYKSFNITDTLHNDLEYVSESSPDAFTFTDDDQKLTWEANPSQLEPGEVTITFKAKVKKDAAANEPIPNEANIDYDNGYQEGDDPSNKVTVTPTVGSLKVIKQDGDNADTKLEGAEFRLEDADGNKIATKTTDSNGVIDFGELDYGNYQLVETKAPDKYNKLRNPIDVTIDEGDQYQTITVNNYKSDWQLPKTGGIGTTLFTAIGTLLMGAALYLYIRRRRETA